MSSPLHRLTDNLADVQADGATIAGLIANLERRYPGFKERLCDADGRLRRSVNVEVNGQDVRRRQKAKVEVNGQDIRKRQNKKKPLEDTPVPDGAEVSIKPARNQFLRWWLPLLLLCGLFCALYLIPGCALYSAKK